MSAHIAWLPRSFVIQFKEHKEQRPRSRPLPLRVRTYSVAGHRSPGFDENRDGVHPRNKSLSSSHEVADFSPTALPKIDDDGEDTDTAGNLSPRTSVDSFAGSSDISDLPGTPLTSLPSERSSLDVDGSDVIAYDFSKLDYELARAKVLGQGLWSTVYLAEQKHARKHRLSSASTLSPPKSPRNLRQRRTGSAPMLYAVKMPARPDAKAIFSQEARVLSHLQRRSASPQHIVPFYGLDDRHHSLVFEAVIGGSLEGLAGRLKQVTEVQRHLELISLFPGIAFDLITGLDFLHTNGVVHADIKPGNVLLDISEHATEQRPVVRARYIDFSAAFIPDRGDSASNAGGTWDYMAPEQMSIRKDVNMPSFASDVWSLGITLLYILVGDSPYAAACTGNLFMLREAIKTGDPLQFARMDAVAQKRLAAAQDFVDCCRQALKKDGEKRTTARAWTSWVEQTGV